MGRLRPDSPARPGAPNGGPQAQARSEASGPPAAGPAAGPGGASAGHLRRLGRQRGGPAWIGILLAILGWTALGILVLSPIWGLLLFKALRRRRRRTQGSDEERAAGAWEDVVDYATDTGLRVPVGATRLTQARAIDARLEDRRAEIPSDTGFHRWDEQCTELVSMARSLDAVVFSDAGAQGGGAERSWEIRDEVVAAISGKTPWYRRYWAFLSTRSLRMRRVPLRVRVDSLIELLAQWRAKKTTPAAIDEATPLKGTDNE